MEFYKNLKPKGWSREQLKPMFVAAHEKLISANTIEQSVKKNITSKEQMILHLEYHPLHCS